MGRTSASLDQTHVLVAASTGFELAPGSRTGTAIGGGYPALRAGWPDDRYRCPAAASGCQAACLPIRCGQVRRERTHHGAVVLAATRGIRSDTDLQSGCEGSARVSSALSASSRWQNSRAVRIVSLGSSDPDGWMSGASPVASSAASASAFCVKRAR